MTEKRRVYDKQLVLSSDVSWDVDEFCKHVQQVKQEIIHRGGDDLELVLECNYINHHDTHDVWIRYERDETDAELNLRIKRELTAAGQIQERELMTLKELAEKYGWGPRDAQSTVHDNCCGERNEGC